MSKFFVVAMVISTGIMIWGLIKQKTGRLWGKHVAAAGALLAALFALGQIFTSKGPGSKEFHASERSFINVSGKYLGKHLAEKYKGARALLILFPPPPAPSMLAADNESALRDGLKEGLGDAISIMEEIKPTSAMMVMLGAPAEWYIKPEELDKLVSPYARQYDMIITMCSLPMNADKLKVWMRQKPPPKIVFAAGDFRQFKKAIADKLIVACLAPHPAPSDDGKGTTGDPEHLEADFNKRYVLITPENVVQMALHFPTLFSNLPDAPKKP